MLALSGRASTQLVASVPLKRPSSSAELAQDPQRLAALRSYDLLDTPPEAEFDEIARLAARLCDAPIALISLIDAERQWFKARVGVDLHETPLDQSICVHTLAEDGIVVIPDTRLDPRSAENPLVAADDGFFFYAGAILKTRGGHPLGTLCVLDRKPRDLAPEQREVLEMLGRQAMTVFELRRQARESEAARLEAEKAVATRDRLISILSHELRTPLTPITLASSALLTDPGTTKAQREQIEMIQRNLKLQVRLIDDLLDYTRLSTQNGQSHFETLDLHKIIREAVDLIRSEPRPVATISEQYCAEPLFARGDPVRLRKAVWRLLLHAADSTPRSGRIVIETHALNEQTARLSVSDNGAGIPLERLPNLFKPFEDKKGTRHAPGLGLDLPLIKGAVELHGGRISASSGGLHAGATFLIELPRTQAEADEEVTTTAPPLPSDVRFRILVLEDQAATAVSLTKLLFRAGHEVLAAGTVSAAREIAARQQVDVLISDIGLPDGTGYDLMNELRQKQNVSGIVLSGHGSPQDLAASRAAGFSIHLTKPIDYADMERALNRVAELRGV